MSKEINIGDRVYSTEKGKECTVRRMWFPYCCELEDDEGNKFFSLESCLEKRRTFAEIVKELAAQLGIPCNIDEEGDVAYLDSEDIGDMRIYDTGQFCADKGYLNPDQLAAISAACTEISTLRKEEQ